MATMTMSVPAYPELAAIGRSDESSTVEKLVKEVQEHFTQANTYYPLVQALQQLEEVYEEFSEANWDGYGAFPVLAEAVSEATLFLGLLSDSHLPMPDISPEVDGGIELEWYKSTSFIFTVNMSGSEILGYSGFYGKRKRTYGTEPLTKEIPASIARNIAQFI